MKRIFSFHRFLNSFETRKENCVGTWKCKILDSEYQFDYEFIDNDAFDENGNIIPLFIFHKEPYFYMPEFPLYKLTNFKITYFGEKPYVLQCEKETAVFYFCNKTFTFDVEMRNHLSADRTTCKFFRCLMTDERSDPSFPELYE